MRRSMGEWTRPTDLTNNSSPEGLPTWAPDGTKIAFVRYDWVHIEAEVYVMNADGTGEVDVSNSPATFDDDPAWDPGDAIKVLRRRCAPGSKRTREERVSCNLSNGTVRS
jgi:hypothetical protein